MNDYLDANRALWNAWTQLHAESPFYDLAGFKAGKSSLRRIEMAELGDLVDGKTLLHLQCHYGQDTLSWARRGAIVTGVDLSPESIALARSLSEELGIPSTFVCSDIACLPDVLDGQFDIVFTSYGVLHWLSDLQRWGEVIAHFLKPGGIFYIVEDHPFMRVFHSSDPERLTVGNPYFYSEEPYEAEMAGSYASDTDELRRFYMWDHMPSQPPSTLHPPPSTDIHLLRSLLDISSLSGQETAASKFLAGWMAEHGMDAFVDAAGNAVGILDGGPAADGQAPQDLVLLGHIDTVGGNVPVRIEDDKLYGRGAVDAKGPLAAFAAAAAQVGPQPGWRIIVVGAVEEEAATSKGARYTATQYRPAMCVIGEPSGWNRVTLGYKGRLLAHVTVQQAMAHTAGPDASVCEVAVDLWNRVRSRVAELNSDKERVWDQVQPSLRSFHSESDGLQETAQMTLGFRLPLEVGPETIQAELLALAGDAELRFEGAEAAFRSDKNTPLVRAFLAAIRGQGEQPGFVLKTGTADMNVVGPVWQCPIVAYGPGDSTLDHTPQEYVDVTEWRQGVAVLVDVLRRLTEAGGQKPI